MIGVRPGLFPIIARTCNKQTTIFGEPAIDLKNAAVEVIILQDEERSPRDLIGLAGLNCPDFIGGGFI